jgi:ATPase subunit of ABC transporter with duplicated ATPase domains
LDLESITALNNALIDFKGTILFNSHDYQFSNTVANRVIEIGPKGCLDKLMTYEEFVDSELVKEQRNGIYA